MSKTSSRRGFLGASAAAVSSLANPGLAAAQAAGVKPADLPDLTIKEVRVYNIDTGSGGATQLAGIVTDSGIEGNYTLGSALLASELEQRWAGWNMPGGRSLGKSVLDLPALTSQWKPELRRLGQLSYASAIDNCLWDALGKAVNLPVYRILGAYRDKVKAYASTQHHAKIEEFVNEVRLVKEQGFTAYKIHPPSPNGGHDYKLDIEVAKAVRKAAGDDFTLLERSGGRLYARGSLQGGPRTAGTGLRLLRRSHPDRRHRRAGATQPGARHSRFTSANSSSRPTTTPNTSGGARWTWCGSSWTTSAASRAG